MEMAPHRAQTIRAIPIDPASFRARVGETKIPEPDNSLKKYLLMKIKKKTSFYSRIANTNKEKNGN